MTHPSAEPEPVEFSIAVLCYGAGSDIVPFVEALHEIMSLYAPPWEIVLVGNYWPDRPGETPRIVRGLAARLERVRALVEPKEGGMGWDMKMGLDACRGRYIGVIDGDGQFPVEAIFSCFAKIEMDDLDFVKTYRVYRSDGLYRKVISSLYNTVFRLLFPAYRGYRDANAKPKILRREAYERMDLRSTDWFLDAEIVLEALQLGLRLYEIPIRFKSLRGRESFVRPGAIFEFAKNLIRYRATRWRGVPERGVETAHPRGTREPR